jgi:hypothetical protein
MKKTVLVLLAAVLCGCSGSRTVVVPVPPRVDLKPYGTIGIVDFSSNAERATSVHATRQFQEQVQEAQPGTRFLELGTRDVVLSAVGARELDPATLRKIGQMYKVNAVFLGDVVYSEPTTDIKLSDISRLQGGMRTELRGDMSTRLFETATGASVWARSAWAKRQLSNFRVSAEQGVTGSVSKTNPREDMVPSLVFQLTHDFRPSTARERVP